MAGETGGFKALLDATFNNYTLKGRRNVSITKCHKMNNYFCSLQIVYATYGCVFSFYFLWRWRKRSKAKAVAAVESAST